MGLFDRIKSDVAASSLAKSATDSIGSRAKGFPVRDRTSTLVGGDTSVSTVTISATSATLLQGGTKQLSATVKNAEGDFLTNIPTWSSDTPACATVDSNGLVSVVGAGTANIKATAGGVDSSNCAVTVTAILTSMSLSPATLNFAHTTTGTTTCTGTDQFGNAMALPGDTAAHSSDQTKATVSINTGTGVITVTGVAAGTTNVTATESTVTSTTCAVTCT